MRADAQSSEEAIRASEEAKVRNTEHLSSPLILSLDTRSGYTVRASLELPISNLPVWASQVLYWITGIFHHDLALLQLLGIQNGSFFG